MTLQLVGKSIKHPSSVIEYVLVKVNKFLLLVDFVVMDMKIDSEAPQILG